MGNGRYCNENVKATIPAVITSASVRTRRLGRRNDVANRNRQYGITNSSATMSFASVWLSTSVGSIFRVSDSPPTIANDSATHPAPRIRWRIHCRAVSTARATNSTMETSARTLVQ